ncbi:tellurite resistance TerB family protein [Cesiribacter andamanensis]|uniref:Tellurite resistance protein n=1 Tax=Cesiribacter andamanensis AMV16 TaxID=1279009 RepID=M7N0A9_9BACT|nr:TerB family tellurite resistance protein [Cesiribacter andamanensis]EMR02133.1 Tellurite resistance protein [Cesiribacter andamanensis AMV16]
MEQEQTPLLKDYSIEERGAYFAALATIASADGTASAEELEFLQLMAEAAELPENMHEELVYVARNPSQLNLQKCLDILKTSPLRFSFITDIISFAKADGQYTAQEKKHIEDMAAYLDINQKQFSILDTYVSKANEAPQEGEDPTSQSFLNKHGLTDMFKNAGISPQMVTGILGVAAPLLIAGMLRGGRGRRGGMMGGGMMGGGLGGLLGGLLGGGMMAGGMRRGGLGSLASVLGGLNGRRGYSSMGSGGLGSLLGGILGGGRKKGW